MRRVTVVVGLMAALFGLAVLLGGGPALADPPFDVPGQITDRSGVLGSGDEARIQEAIDELQSDEGLQLFVVYVGSFDGIGPDEWADETAEESGFGGNDVLFAVAVDDRRYGLSVDEAFPKSDSELDDLLASDVEPELADDDWAGAAVALADGLGGGSNTTAWVLGGVAVVGGGAYLVARSRRKKSDAALDRARQGPPDPHAGVSTEQLQFQASSALLELDEAVKGSALQLDFARSQFGEEAVAGFGEALAQSQAELARAFTLRQQLDDEVPEDEPAQRRMLAEILTLVGSADDRLDDQEAAFEKLRDLERTAPQVLDALGPRITDLRGRIPTAEQRLADLRSRYAASALEPVGDNVAEATARLTAAEAEIAEARADLAGGQSGNAVSDVRAAEDAVAQTATLLDAIDARAAELAAAGGRIAALRAETEKDLAEARALAQGGDRTGLTPQIARAEAALAEAETLLVPGGGLPAPLAALRQLEEADAALEQALGPARDAEARARRAAAGLEETLASARAAIGSASDFIATRRGAVGPEPRTRLSEAQRHLDAAVGLASTDPVTAQQEAQTAAALGRRALDAARSELDTYTSGGGGYGGYAPGGFSGGYRSGGGIDLGSLVLGGILNGGGGGYRGGYRSSGFGGGRSRSSGGFSSGGRRSSSSRSSGGRRSRGGRF